MKKLLLLAMCLSALGVFAARTITVKSQTDSSFRLEFGPSDGETYLLYAGYGEKDGGGDTTAWANFVKIADIGADQASYDYAVPAGWGTSVKAIRFFLAGLPKVITDEWWRFTFTKLWYRGQKRFALGDIRLWADASQSVDQAYGIVPGSGTDASKLAPGTAITTLALTMTKPSDFTSCNLWDLRNCFDGSNFNAIYAPLSAELEDSPRTITLRLPQGHNSVVSYSMIACYSPWYWHPTSWYVETSNDGVHFTKIDARADRVTNGSNYTDNPYVPNVPVVVSQTETQSKMNVLTVSAGSPRSITSAVTYDEVRLYDKLTIYGGGDLTATTIKVMGENGGIVVDGGKLNTASRLVIPADLATAKEYVDALTIRYGCDVTLEQAKNENPNVAARVVFDGGSVRCTSFSAKPFCVEPGAKWILESVEGKDIVLGNLQMQRFNWLSGNGAIETRGNGNVIIYDTYFNNANQYYGTAYMNASTTPDCWNNAGAFVLSNGVVVACQVDNCLPYGSNTGNVQLWWVNRGGMPPPKLDLGGRVVSVNGIDAEHSDSVNVTNSSSTAATLRLGVENTEGSLTNLVLSGGNINLVKTGTGRNVFTLGSSSVKDVTVESGELVINGSSADLLSAASVTVASGAKLVVDGAVVRAFALSVAGTLEKVNGGEVECAAGGWDSADSVIYDDFQEHHDRLCKVGSNRLVLQLDKELPNELMVDGGSVVFAGRIITNEWWRMTLTKSFYTGQKAVQFGDIRFYDNGTDLSAATDMVQGLLPDAPGTAPANLSKGRIVTTLPTTTTKPAGAQCNLWDIRNAFDDSVYNAVYAPLTAELSDKPHTLTWRMPEGRNRVQCYKVFSSYLTWYWVPSGWYLETSADGNTWTKVDTRAVTTGWGTGASIGGSVPFFIKGVVTGGAKGLSPTAKLSLSSGGSVDFANVAGGQVLTRLEVDCSTEAGVVSNFTVGRGGTLYLANVPKGNRLVNFEVPVALENAADGKNFDTWKLVVNGVPSNRRYLTWENGRLVTQPTAMTIFIK